MDTTSPFRVALIAMPWSIFNRPSIQLGTLQSFLNSHQGVTADSFHPYLHLAKKIGLERYSKITLSGWGGEALFAPLLFPEKFEDAKRLYKQSVDHGTKQQHQSDDFSLLTSSIEEFCKLWLKQNDLSGYDLIGFSVCFSQLLPSLYLARLLKQQHQNCTIVFGGSSCSDELGRSLTTHFEDVDYVISGEGENSLLLLSNFLRNTSSKLPSNIFYGQSEDKRNPTQVPDGQEEITATEIDLNVLPPPNYLNYFKEMTQLFPGSPFIPVIPVEFSRGCWWNKCTFCNLNIQWDRYRYKSNEKMLHDTLQLCKTYESLSFAFTDNALPPKEADSFFSQLAKLDIDFNFFAEIRAAASPEQLKIYRKAGLTSVQVGIEALSSSLLRKMAKGSSTIENIAIIKACAQYDIQLEGNLIVEFPSSSAEEVQQTLDTLDCLLPFKPLDTATFFLGYGSPIFNNCKNFSITHTLTHPKNRKLFPQKLLQSMTLLLNSYRGDRKVQQKLWTPVREKVHQWKAFHNRRSHTEFPLSYRDGRTFLIIRQEQQEGPVLQHRLRGLSRKIYLACESVLTVEKLYTLFPQVKEDALRQFLGDMCRKRLMYEEEGRVLALAVRSKSNNTTDQ